MNFKRKILCFILLLIFVLSICACQAIEEERERQINDETIVFEVSRRERVEKVATYHGLTLEGANSIEQYTDIKSHLIEEDMIIYYDIWGDTECDKISQIFGYSSFQDYLKTNNYNDIEDLRRKTKTLWYESSGLEEAYAENVKKELQAEFEANNMEWYFAEHELEEYIKIKYKFNVNHIYIYYDLWGIQQCDLICQALGYQGVFDCLTQNGFVDGWGDASFRIMKEKTCLRLWYEANDK